MLNLTYISFSRLLSHGCRNERNREQDNWTARQAHESHDVSQESKGNKTGHSGTKMTPSREETLIINNTMAAQCQRTRLEPYCIVKRATL